jgi:hypothetical protein
MTTQDNLNISTILTLESLEKEYQNTMILYEQAQTNYNSALNGVVRKTNSSNTANSVVSNGKNYILVPSRIFWGTDAIQQKSLSNISDCVALCSADSKCTGATFDSQAKSCWTRSGNGPIMMGTTNQTAIVSELISSAIVLKTLNDKLMSLLKQMNSINVSTTTKLQKRTDNDITTNNLFLEKQYQNLMTDRENINNILKEYGEIKVKNDDQGLYLYQNQISYMLWSILCFISLFIVFKVAFFPDANFKWIKFIIWTVITSSLLILVSYLRLANAFIMFSIIIAIILFILMKIIAV